MIRLHDWRVCSVMAAALLISAGCSQVARQSNADLPRALRQIDPKGKLRWATDSLAGFSGERLVTIVARDGDLGWATILDRQLHDSTIECFEIAKEEGQPARKLLYRVARSEGERMFNRIRAMVARGGRFESDSLRRVSHYSIIYTVTAGQFAGVTYDENSSVRTQQTIGLLCDRDVTRSRGETYDTVDQERNYLQSDAFASWATLATVATNYFDELCASVYAQPAAKSE